MSYITEQLAERAEELIDLAATLELELPQAVLRGTRDAIAYALAGHVRCMQQLEQEIRDNEQAAKRAEAKRAILQTIAERLSESSTCKVTIEMGRWKEVFLRGTDFNIELKSLPITRWTSQENARLVVNIHGETRRYPRKKDGTFNITGIKTFIYETRASRAVRQTAEEKRADALKRFNALLKPYTKRDSYETHAELRGAEAIYRVEQIGENGDQYRIAKVVTTYETVSADRAAEILASALPTVERPAQGY